MKSKQIRSSFLTGPSTSDSSIPHPSGSGGQAAHGSDPPILPSRWLMVVGGGEGESDFIYTYQCHCRHRQKFVIVSMVMARMRSVVSVTMNRTTDAPENNTFPRTMYVVGTHAIPRTLMGKSLRFWLLMTDSLLTIAKSEHVYANAPSNGRWVSAWWGTFCGTFRNDEDNLWCESSCVNTIHLDLQILYLKRVKMNWNLILNTANLRVRDHTGVKARKWGIHSEFETQGRRHRKCKQR